MSNISVELLRLSTKADRLEEAVKRVIRCVGDVDEDQMESTLEVRGLWHALDNLLNVYEETRDE